jgi:hypothetical protein
MRYLLLLAILVLMCGRAEAAETVRAQGGAVPVAEDSDPTRAAEWRQVRANLAKLAPVIRAQTHHPDVSYPTQGQLQLPLLAEPSSLSFAPNGISNHVDLGPNLSTLLDYNCGQRTYVFGSYQHSGTDLFLTPFPWTMMANDEVDVVAAVGGTVVYTHDGEPDHNCALSSTAVPNVIYVSQDDGMIGRYLHLKTGSLVVSLQQPVEQGQKLANVGSSGSSTGPHLHYEVAKQDSTGTIVEPFAGQCNAGASGWRHQGAYNSSIITRIATHASQPVFGSSSCDMTEPVVQRSFSPGQTVYVALYLRDMLQGQTVSWQIFDSTGTLQQTVPGSPLSVPFYAFAYWYAPLTLPADAAPGTWRIRATFESDMEEGTFFVTSGVPAETALAAAVLPASRSIVASHTATVFATVLNGGGTKATGCGIYPVSPLDGVFTFQTTNPQTNAVTGTVNQVVDIAAGQGQSFVLAVTPNSDAVANALELGFRFFCANAPAPASIPGVNTLQLSISQTPVPDILAVGATASGDGYLDLPSPTGSGAFSVAAVDIGTTGTMTVTPRNTGGFAASIAICGTNPTNGNCLAAPASTVTTNFGIDQSQTFSIFVTSTAPIADNPATNRVYVDFIDSTGLSRGAASVAVRSH